MAEIGLEVPLNERFTDMRDPFRPAYWDRKCLPILQNRSMKPFQFSYYRPSTSLPPWTGSARDVWDSAQVSAKFPRSAKLENVPRDFILEALTRSRGQALFLLL